MKPKHLCPYCGSKMKLLGTTSPDIANADSYACSNGKCGFKHYFFATTTAEQELELKILRHYLESSDREWTPQNPNLRSIPTPSWREMALWKVIHGEIKLDNASATALTAETEALLRGDPRSTSALAEAYLARAITRGNHIELLTRFPKKFNSDEVVDIFARAIETWAHVVSEDMEIFNANQKQYFDPLKAALTDFFHLFPEQLLPLWRSGNIERFRLFAIHANPDRLLTLIDEPDHILSIAYTHHCESKPGELADGRPCGFELPTVSGFAEIYLLGLRRFDDGDYTGAWLYFQKLRSWAHPRFAPEALWEEASLTAARVFKKTITASERELADKTTISLKRIISEDGPDRLIELADIAWDHLRVSEIKLRRQKSDAVAERSHFLRLLKIFKLATLENDREGALAEWLSWNKGRIKFTDFEHYTLTRYLETKAPRKVAGTKDPGSIIIDWERKLRQLVVSTLKQAYPRTWINQIPPRIRKGWYTCLAEHPTPSAMRLEEFSQWKDYSEIIKAPGNWKCFEDIFAATPQEKATGKERLLAVIDEITNKNIRNDIHHARKLSNVNRRLLDMNYIRFLKIYKRWEGKHRD